MFAPSDPDDRQTQVSHDQSTVQGVICSTISVYRVDRVVSSDSIGRIFSITVVL